HTAGKFHRLSADGNSFELDAALSDAIPANNIAVAQLEAGTLISAGQTAYHVAANGQVSRSALTNILDGIISSAHRADGGLLLPVGDPVYHFQGLAAENLPPVGIRIRRVTVGADSVYFDSFFKNDNGTLTYTQNEETTPALEYSLGSVLFEF